MYHFYKFFIFLSMFSGNTHRLRDHGLKVTKAREAVLSLLAKEHKPLTIADIQTKLPKDLANLTTLYRMMQIFVEKGLVKQIHLSSQEAFYELSSRPHHHHFVCLHCHKIEDIQDCLFETIQDQFLKETKSAATIESHSFELFGTCKKCFNLTK